MKASRPWSWAWRASFFLGRRCATNLCGRTILPLFFISSSANGERWAEQVMNAWKNYNNKRMLCLLFVYSSVCFVVRYTVEPRCSKTRAVGVYVDNGMKGLPRACRGVGKYLWQVARGGSISLPVKTPSPKNLFVSCSFPWVHGRNHGWDEKKEG